jgi:hypothetical protein
MPDLTPGHPTRSPFPPPSGKPRKRLDLSGFWDAVDRALGFADVFFESDDIEERRQWVAVTIAGAFDLPFLPEAAEVAVVRLLIDLADELRDRG